MRYLQGRSKNTWCTERGVDAIVVDCFRSTNVDWHFLRFVEGMKGVYPGKRSVFVGESEHPSVRARAPGFVLGTVDQGKLCLFY